MANMVPVIVQPPHVLPELESPLTLSAVIQKCLPPEKNNLTNN